jgi:uncharacterized protein
MDYHGFQFEVKEVSEAGAFAGLASTYGNTDLGGDVVLPGAFTRTLQERGLKRTLLWAHQTQEPIGVASLSDGQDGLSVTGKLTMAVQRAKEVYALLKDGAVGGLSIGFHSARDAMKDGVRQLADLDLYEVSLVAIPMNPRAQVTAVKGADVASIRGFERWLRDAGGFSRSRAAAIATKGWAAAMATPDVDPETELLTWLQEQVKR